MLDVTASGRSLARSFARLGSMTGKTADQIISAVGSPNSRSSMALGKTLLQWQATGYHISILFDVNGVFEKVTHEYANLQPEPEPAPDGTDYSKYILIVASILLALILVGPLFIRWLFRLLW